MTRLDKIYFFCQMQFGPNFIKLMTSMTSKFLKNWFSFKIKKKYPVPPLLDYQFGNTFFLESDLKIQQDDSIGKISLILTFRI